MKKVVDYLESIGNRWTKGEHDRVYIKLNEIAKVEKFGQNWNEIKINGVDISKTNLWKAREAVATFTTKYPRDKMYYDIKTDEIYFSGNETVRSIMTEIAEDIRTKILELSK
jgi:hypothetical protein